MRLSRYKKLLCPIGVAAIGIGVILFLLSRQQHRAYQGFAGSSGFGGYSHQNPSGGPCTQVGSGFQYCNPECATGIDCAQARDNYCSQYGVGGVCHDANTGAVETMTLSPGYGEPLGTPQSPFAPSPSLASYSPMNPAAPQPLQYPYAPPPSQGYYPGYGYSSYGYPQGGYGYPYGYPQMGYPPQQMPGYGYGMPYGYPQMPYGYPPQPMYPSMGYGMAPGYPTSLGYQMPGMPYY